MSKLLTLFKAARLAGVSRSEIQQKIQGGALPTFEGFVSVEDLLACYPETRIEDNSAIEKLIRHSEVAFARQMQARILPDADVLAARLTELGLDHARLRTGHARQRELLSRLGDEIKSREDTATPEARTALASLRGWLQQQLAVTPEAVAFNPFEVRESFLRIFAAHVRVMPSGHEYFVEGTDSLLDAGLRAGLRLDYGCGTANCGRCKARLVSGQSRATRPAAFALTDEEKRADTLLLCCHTAVTDVVIEAAEARDASQIGMQRIETRVKATRPLEGSSLQLLHLQTPSAHRLRFLAGQSLRLKFEDGTSAVHPIASCPCDDRNLLFHVPRRAGDAFAEHVFNSVQSGDRVEIDGPYGDFTLAVDTQRAPVFLAQGTGFAPISSLIEYALSLDAAERIHLYRFTATEEAPYLDNQCRAWGDALDHFHYRVLPAPQGMTAETLLRHQMDVMLATHADLHELDIYAAGSPTFVEYAGHVLRQRGVPGHQLHLEIVSQGTVRLETV